ncbi:MAG: putative nucleotidyltransferase [Patescibacteria group bacterium]|jgi:predicted nucleotidyltransferase
MGLRLFGMDVETIKNKIVPILQKEGVTKAGIFGSYARGDNKRGSDVDVLIEIDDSYSLFDLIRLQQKLSQKIRRKVDLGEYSMIRKEIKKGVLGDEIRIL